MSFFTDRKVNVILILTLIADIAVSLAKYVSAAQ